MLIQFEWAKTGEVFTGDLPAVPRKDDVVELPGAPFFVVENVRWWADENRHWEVTVRIR